MKFNKIKKFFALFFVLIVIIPLTSSLGLWEKLAEAEDAFATGKDAVAENADVVTEAAEGETINPGSVKYKFSLGIDEDIYDHDAKFTFNGVEYQGVFRNDIKKSDNNMQLKIEELGTLENPYVILEIVPEESISVMRPHVGYLNHFDMTQEQLDEICLTDYEKNVVKLQFLYQLSSGADGQTKLAEYNEQLANLTDEKNEIITYIGVTYDAEIRAEVIATYPNDANQWYVPEHLIDAMKLVYCERYSPRYKDLLIEIANVEGAVKALDIINTVSNRGTEDINITLDNIALSLISNGIISEEDYRDYLDIKLKNALEYKRDYYQSVTLNTLMRNQYPYNLEYVTRYEVDSDGNFAFYSDGDTKTVTTTTATNTYSAISNEVKTTMQVINPLYIRDYMYGDEQNNRLLIHDETFTKGCINMGYNSVMSDTGIVLSETPFIDEYIFAGWSVKIGDDLVNINSLDDDFDLKENNITQLYTNWVVRYYEQSNYEVLTTAGYVSVDFKCEDATYAVMLPDCIASKQEGFHDYRNQLTMCVARKHKFLQTWSTDFKGFIPSQDISYSEEISSWDFKFKVDDYKTVADLKKVAPKLMADTDYYVATKNAVYENGVVTYYPYNVLVITATPEELNKMVYYDAVYNGKDANVGYQQSTYLNKFLDAVDFVFFSNGGNSLEFYTAYFGEKTVRDPCTCSMVAVERYPVINRNPLLYSLNDNGVLTYDRSKVPLKGSYQSTYNSIVDLEWQICEKIYQRVAEPKDFAQSGKGQSRSMVVVFDESLGDNVSTKAGVSWTLVDAEGNYTNDGNGTGDNLAKLMLMFFVYRNPQTLYDWYIDLDYSEELNGVEIKWDKIKGAVRTVEIYNKKEDAMSNFTGVLYGYEQWNQSLFFPFEYYEIDHTAALIDSGETNTASRYFRPENTAEIQEMYDLIGLAKWVNFKRIASPYAYTFNGDNSLAREFFDYTIPEISNSTNGNEYNGCTDLAFEFFRRVNPYKIKNDMISTKDAIKFMIAAAQNSSLTTAKEILILNKADEKTRFSYGTYTMYVDTIFAEDFNKLAENIEYKYITDMEGFCVPEVLWTQQYSEYKKNNLGDSHWYSIFTNKPEDSPLKWYVVPDALENADKNNYYITYNIETSAGKDENGNDVTVRTLTKDKSLYKYFDGNKNLVTTDQSYIEQKSEYYLEALLKPAINDKVWDQRTYMIAIKHYNSYNDFKAGKAPESITVKPVVIEKLTYLFNLD